jgi:hypothetical protein
MDITEIRRANLARLVNQAGTQRKLAEQTDSDALHVSQMMTGRRNMGDKVARRIEAKLGLPHGWMDAPQAETPAVAEALALYRVDPSVQARLLTLFEKLTQDQQEQFIKEITAAAKTNEIIIREVGPRLHPPADEYVGKFLPKAPEKSTREEQRGK